MLGRLHVLTDFVFQQRFAHAELAHLAIAGGADVIQFRQKTGTARAKLHELRPVADACQETQTALLVDDHLDLALAVGADGVHLGQTDLPIPDARRIFGPDAILGATATTLAQARQAEACGATYIGFGPVFSGRSKAAPASTKGLHGLAAVCAAVSIPVIAIGGVTADRMADVLDAGAHGVAVMTAISTAHDPEAATRAFRTAIDAACGVDASP
ncbi:MAG: thiamine phosphate synthase [Bacteroidota bacterium]